MSDEVILRWILEYATSKKFTFIISAVQDLVTAETLEELKDAITFSTIDHMIQPTLPDAAPDFVTAAVLVDQLCRPSDYDDATKRGSEDHLQFDKMLGLLKVQALFWIAQHSSAPENRIGEFKHVFDEVFPGGKHRHKRAGVPPLAVALLDVVTGKDDDNAKNAKIANLLNGEELDRFRENFAAYLLPFKRRLPVPVLERVYQDIAQKRYVVGEGAATPARRKGKKSAADDDSADNGASRKRTTVAIDQDDDDDNAPPTPPRANSNSRLTTAAALAKSGDNNAVTMSNLLAMRIHQVMDESGLQSAPVPVAKDNKSKKVSRGVSAVAMASAIAAQSPAKLAGQKRKESSAAAEKTPVAARKRGARSAPRTGGDAADDDEVEEAEAEAVAEKGDAAEAPKKPAPAKKAAAKKAQTPQRRAADARTKASEASGGPRKRIRWSEEEEHNLSAGVRRFGVGAWSSILDQFYFEARTTIDLKDKWRNMQKSQQKQELRAKAVAARAAMEEKGDKDDDANDDDASADNAAPKE